MVQGHVLAYDQVTGFGLVRRLLGSISRCCSSVVRKAVLPGWLRNRVASSSASEPRSGVTRKEEVVSKRGAKNRRWRKIAVAPWGPYGRCREHSL